MSRGIIFPSSFTQILCYISFCTLVFRYFLKIFPYFLILSFLSLFSLKCSCRANCTTNHFSPENHQIISDSGSDFQQFPTEDLPVCNTLVNLANSNLKVLQFLLSCISEMLMESLVYFFLWNYSEEFWFKRKKKLSVYYSCQSATSGEAF